MGAHSQRFSRRSFVAGTSSFIALHSVANLLPLPPLGFTIGAAIKKIYAEQQFK